MGEKPASRPSPDEIEITLEMVTAGVRAYFAWDYEKEDVEALVVEVFFRMSRSQ